jgi:glycosyltransferase involved in cell wall biosynthesis
VARGQRIIFINRFFHPDLSSTSQMLSDLAPRLAAVGFDVHIVCSRQLYDDPKAPLEREETLGATRVHRVWTSRFGRNALLGRAVDYVTFQISAAAKLLRITRRGDVLVAKTDPPLVSIVAAWVAGRRGAHLVNWLQDIFPEIASHLGANPLPARLDGVLKSMRTWSLRAARMNVVIGERMREFLALERVPAAQVCVIENWADGDAIKPMAACSSALRRSLPTPAGFVVAYSGNLGRAHEYSTFLDAATELQRDREVLFLMIGGGAQMRLLRGEVAERGLGNFLFLPYQARDTLNDSLGAADVHLACLLPRLEGLVVPSKFYGILAAGRPVIFIGDSDGDIARVVRRSGCGSIVAIGDSAALAAEIRRLKLDSAALEGTGRRARRLFEDSYTLDAAVGKWITLLRGLDSHQDHEGHEDVTAPG